jgi:hypothetical protein
MTKEILTEIEKQKLITKKLDKVVSPITPFSTTVNEMLLAFPPSMNIEKVDIVYAIATQIENRKLVLTPGRQLYNKKQYSLPGIDIEKYY